MKRWLATYQRELGTDLQYFTFQFSAHTWFDANASANHFGDGCANFNYPITIISLQEVETDNG